MNAITQPITKANNKKLPANSLRPEGSLFYRHQVLVPSGHTLEDILNPDYWAHYTQTLRQNSVIECVADDASFEADLRVEAVGAAWVRVRLLREWKRPKGAAAITPERDRYKIEHTPAGWQVIFDNSVNIAQGLISEDEAVKAVEKDIAQRKGG